MLGGGLTNHEKMNFSRKKLGARLVRQDEQTGQYFLDIEL